jgi:protocatechuate 3,4-dioxygenase beta subunit
MLTQARDTNVSASEVKLQAFLQERKMGRVAAGNELELEGRTLEKITAAVDNAVFQDEQTAPTIIEGLVIDTRTRQPIAGARVSLERGQVPVDLSKEPSASVTTNERGRFRFERVKPGVYRLRAAKWEYLSSSFQIVEAESGRAATREIPLDPLAKLSGRVLDYSNYPVKGARVGVFFGFSHSSVAWKRLLSERGFSVLACTTESQGKFEFFVPDEEAQVNLVALALGYAPSRSGPLSTRAGQAQAGIRLHLSRGLEAQGRIVNEAGTPIPNATISAHSLKLGETSLRLGFGDIEPSVKSDADGRIVLRGLEEGTYKLRVSHASYATNVVPDVEIKSKATNRLPDIVLLEQAEIRGQVTDTNGQPISRAKISAFTREVGNSEVVSDNDGSFALNGFGSGASVTLTANAEGYSNTSKVAHAPSKNVVLVLSRLGALRGRVEDAEIRAPIREFQIYEVRGRGRSFHSEDGTFKWEGIASGRRTFVAQAPGYQVAEVAGIEIRAGEPAEEVVFSLTRGLELAGRVVDAVTGVGLSNVTLRYFAPSEPEPSVWAGGWNKQVTDSDGNFKFDGLPAEKVTIIAKSELYAESRRTVVPNEESVVEIRLTKGAFVSGRVVGLDGTTAPSWARVNLQALASAGVTRYSESESSVFSFSGLAAGAYRLTAETNLGQTKPQEIVLHENERVTGLLLVVQAGATIRGKVTGLRSDESRVEISVQRQGVNVGTASTDTDGTYVIHGLPTGRVEVLAYSYSGRSISKSVEIPKGTLELTLNIEFPLEARLSGRVTRGGQPVVNKIVSAFLRDSTFTGGTGKTDHTGHYIIEGLSNGDYYISFEGEWTKSIRILGDTTLDIELSTISLSGRILEANSGQPLSGVTVNARRVNSVVDTNTSRTAITDSQGRFFIEGIEPGQYRVVAYRRQFKVGTELLSVSGSSEIVIPLTPADK